MIAWTYSLNPFSIGWAKEPIGFEVNVSKMEKIDLGKGYFGYVFSSISGKSIVVESKSGAIIGNSVKQVREDIAEADEKVMAEQIKNAINEQKRVKILEACEFWEIYDKI